MCSIFAVRILCYRRNAEARSAWLQSVDALRAAIDVGITGALQTTALPSKLRADIEAVRRTALEAEIQCALGKLR